MHIQISTKGRTVYVGKDATILGKRICCSTGHLLPIQHPHHTTKGLLTVMDKKEKSFAPEEIYGYCAKCK